MFVVGVAVVVAVAIVVDVAFATIGCSASLISMGGINRTNGQ